MVAKSAASFVWRQSAKKIFIVTHTHHMIFNFASKEKGLISPLCNTPEARAFNFYFSLRHRSFEEQALLVYCFWEFIKSTTRCLVFCFTAQFTRTLYCLFSLLSCRRRNITSVITLVEDYELDNAVRFFRKYWVVWSREAKAKGRLIN